MKMVCLKTANWIFVLMLIFPGSVLFAEDPPSVQDQAFLARKPVANAPVPPALRQALASSLGEAASFGAKAIPTPPTGSWGIVSEGDGGGGIFRDSDSEAETWLGSEGIGVHGFGVQAGGFFQDTDNTGYAYVGYLGWGIGGFGISAGGYFEDSDGTGRAWVGKDNFGIEAHGNVAGGFFMNSGGSGSAYAGGYYWGIEAHGNGGGYFVDSDGPAFAAVGHDDFGIDGYGPVAGGHFAESDGTGQAWVGHGDGGIEARGTYVGGYFVDSDGSGQAYVGYGDVGIDASGSGAGGIFQNTISDEEAWLAAGGGFGVQGFGPEGGGHFEDTDGTAWAEVANGDWGIEARGETAGGYFKDLTGTGVAYVGHADYGIEALGTQMGGYFADSDGTGHAYVGINDTGIIGIGATMGGKFGDDATTAWAWLGWERLGVYAAGYTAGGRFWDPDSSGSAFVAYGDRGIEAFGDGAGGHFEDLDEGTYSNVAISTYSIHGNGTKAFVQNHPYDRDSVIVYAAPEGDEVATYTRGTARLVNGEARVPLGETFKWVTNPDIGLTVHLTPVGDACVLYVVEQATDEITVGSDGGNDCTFHYIVYGLRIGFEEMSIVQEKQQESYIPSMADHRQLYERRPNLKSYNSLERFKGMRIATDQKAELDLSRAHALRDAIVEFDPAIHTSPSHHDLNGADEQMPVAPLDDHDMVAVEQGRGRSDQSVETASPSTQIDSTVIPMDAEGNVYATSFRPSSMDLASLVTVSESVEPGDVLVIDRSDAGKMRRGFEGNDTGVIGVVAANAGLVLGTQRPPSRNSGPREVEIDDIVPGDSNTVTSPSQRAAVAFAGVATCKVDADYGAVWPGDLLVTSPTPGHAMRADAPLPGTVLGKALEPLQEGIGAIKVLVMLR